MESNTNFGAGEPGGFAPFAPTPASDAFAVCNALERAVKNLPASRPEAVARARALAADPGYPSSDILRQVSRLLAGRLTSETRA